MGSNRWQTSQLDCKTISNVKEKFSKIKGGIVKMNEMQMTDLVVQKNT